MVSLHRLATLPPAYPQLLTMPLWATAMLLVAGGVNVAAAAGVLEAARYVSAEVGAEPNETPLPLARPSSASPSPTWRYYRTAPGSGDFRPTQVQYLPTGRASQTRSHPAANVPVFGFADRQDPLFDTGTRPNYDRQFLEKPLYDRESYERPSYTKPLDGQTPPEKPRYEQPLYLKPNDDKPNNALRHYQPPQAIRPSTPVPVDLGPNYVVPELTFPSDRKPGKDQSWWDRPSYTAPVAVPPRYEPERYVPLPYLAPPR